MKRIKYNNATIYIYGEVNREKIEQATIRFIKQADLCRKRKLKGKSKNDNSD